MHHPKFSLSNLLGEKGLLNKKVSSDPWEQHTWDVRDFNCTFAIAF